MKFTRTHHLIKPFFFIPIVLLPLLCGLTAHASGRELSIEGSVDGTPAELRQLLERASLLDAKINELERRLAESQRAVVGSAAGQIVDYRLELKPSADDQSRREMLVSHVRMSLNGRPFVYTQSAILVSPTNPLPLFMGKIAEGRHTVRLQFQTSPFAKNIISGSTTAWRTIDKIIQLNIDADAGSQQNFSIALGESEVSDPAPSKIENAPQKETDSLPLLPDGQKESK
ncbi:MAG: hypothetical protein EBR09_01785 [Proteobacteria bacterium]|nr:hypothetical protein [Pseudomonadota bacterium]